MKYNKTVPYYVEGWCSPAEFVHSTKGAHAFHWRRRMSEWERFIGKGKTIMAMWEAETAYLLAKSLEVEEE